MFPISLCSVSQNSNYHFYEHHSFFCSICEQRFSTEKNFRRHITSRKHIQQSQHININSYRIIKRPHPIVNKLDLLPNEVIAELVSDLTDQIDQKENFFNDIQLVETNEIDNNTDSVPVQPFASKTQLCVKTSPIFYRTKKSIRIPAAYPCSTCFQLLDSQQNFNEHMFRAHFNMSVDVENNVDCIETDM